MSFNTRSMGSKRPTFDLLLGKLVVQARLRRISVPDPLQADVGEGGHGETGAASLRHGVTCAEVERDQ
jgi:hypothetical protein